MNKLVVKLKQHTPLIHFQHSQEGATLRASEVKPKLDKYIIKKVFDDEWDKCKEYIIGYKKSKKEDDKEKKEDEIKLNRDLERKFKEEGYRALNYKMRIETKNSNGEILNKIPMYFASMGKNEKKGIVYNTNNPTYLFFVIDETLWNEMKNSIAEFFIVTNFGTRQSKGYGSFYIDKKDPLYQCPDKFLRSGKLSHIQTKVCTKCKDWVKTQEVVDVFYKTLRSGINVCAKICSCKELTNKCKTIKKSNVNIVVDYKQSEHCCKNCNHYIKNGSIFYFKSALYYYVNYKLKKQWDKKTIKEALYEGKCGKNELFRDLLGLAPETIIRKYKIKKESKKEIVRYKSPIFIKPIQDDNNIFTFYVGFEDIDSNMLGTDFNINKIDGNISSKLLELKTPSDFKMDDYFKYLFEGCNFTIDKMVGNKVIKNQKTNEVVKPDSKQHEYYELLKDIYDQLRHNYIKP